MSARSCPPWCVDHRHEMAGPDGECHSESWRHSDGVGPTVSGELTWFDDDAEPLFFLTLTGHEREHLVWMSLEVLDAIAEAMALFPNQTTAVLEAAQDAMEQVSR